MSHNHEPIICPNCGYHATDNYCAQCGQETHLHNDTFWGLIMHFIGHYFHYDSKFWKTMKALWFSPGKLTIAYWEKKRMRYIAPVSLYIFISVTFFLVNTILPAHYFHRQSSGNAQTDSIVRSVRLKLDKLDDNTAGLSAEERIKVNAQDSLVKKKLAKISEHKSEINEQMKHMLPKVFFFMIPLMGFILLLLFARRKGTGYVNHIIFALHYHTFWFSLMLVYTLYRFDLGRTYLLLLTMLISVVYFIIALRNTYKVSWARSISYSVITAIVYALFLFIAILAASALIGMQYLF